MPQQTLWCVLGCVMLIGSCKDTRSDRGIKPTGPAGIPQAEEATSSEGQHVSPQWPAPRLTQKVVGGAQQWTIQVMTSPPTTAQADEQRRLALGAAQMKAQIALLKALEKQQGTPLNAQAIQHVSQKMKMTTLEELKGGAISVEFSYRSRPLRPSSP